ncbi:MarR family winged helix-turn-helix transcriptional regulator [Nocardia macrotermitis]|uniref:HTH marR-type domain-containing protein n=1 Tax=Nocardia macrotermitis TaxID=2585198 RepID=A0A7K0DEC1_9NOCA|nr:MarR family transcriptional regulator [Nocardia macrotermitis]MQY23214.1 hypothetical protein [Nocardia macrotermitis]
MTTADAEDFLTVYWSTKRAVTLAASAAYARHGVYEGQQFILRSLWAEDGLTPGEVAKRLGLSTPTITRAATRMAAAGLLRREPHPTDRRLVRLYLTERGRDLEVTIEDEMAGLTDRALAGFEDAERVAVVRALDRIRSNLARETSDSPED